MSFLQQIVFVVDFIDTEAFRKAPWRDGDIGVNDREWRLCRSLGNVGVFFALLIRNSSAASGIFWILTTTVTTNKFSVCDRLKRKGGKHHENKAGFCNGAIKQQ